MSEDDYIDPTYNKLFIESSNEKLLAVLRLIVLDLRTADELKDKTGFHMTQVRRSLKKAIKENYVEAYPRKRSHIFQPGRPPVIRKNLPFQDKKLKTVGRPEIYYSITSKGRWLMRFDPQVRDLYFESEKTYKEPNLLPFDSYLDLRYEVKQNPKLNRFPKYDHFLHFDYPLQLMALHPFLFVPESKDNEAMNIYNLLIDCVEKTVKPEHILDYYLAVEKSLERFQRAIDRHKALLDAMKKLPEVKEYLAEKDNPAAI
jgi:hypothetical protein